jgi:hypothetical protein
MELRVKLLIALCVIVVLTGVVLSALVAITGRPAGV